MTEEDEEFNRIERESMMRMKAVAAVVTRGGSRTTIEMAREAAGDDWGLFQEYMPEIHRLVELVRADEKARMAEQPAQRTWVGLTDEEIAKLDLSAVTVKDATSDVRAIEAKLKEKNT